MSQQEIQAYNQTLVHEGEVTTVIEYVKKLNEKFYHMDISFIDDFIELVDKEGFIIHHSMLEKYGVLKIRDSHDMKRVFESHEFEEGKYYEISPALLRAGCDYMVKTEILRRF